MDAGGNQLAVLEVYLQDYLERTEDRTDVDYAQM